MNSKTLQACVVAVLGWVAPVAADVGPAIEALRAVAGHGAGNERASEAWKTLATSEPSLLTAILRGMDGAGPLPSNWIATAADAVAERATRDGKPLPVGDLGAFLLDTSHTPRARRMAYDLIVRSDAKLARALLPGLLNDPASELRREAVQVLVDAAGERLGSKDIAGAGVLYRQALQFAREAEQVELVAKKLREQGASVDLAHLFGWLRNWQVIGPFDNRERKGFEAAYGPESNVDFRAELDGVAGKVKWSSLISTNEFGLVDINKSCGSLKEVVAYAYTEVESDRSRPVELRLGCKNAWKVWLNGRFLFGRDEYHAGMEIDQYRLPVQLDAGRNRILVKVCQNEQKEEWTVEWEFQLRFCDPEGATIRFGTPPSLASVAASTSQVGESQPAAAGGRP